MELPAEGKLEQKPCRKETLKGNGESLITAGERKSYCTVAVLNKVSSAFCSLTTCVLVLEILMFL